ncbi:hypothetical protein MBLNU230_g7621t1 [Neophaeotheca triangularis]
MAGPPSKKQKREEARETRGEAALPQKKFYRQRAHANVFSDHHLQYPVSPESMDWSQHYPNFVVEDVASATKEFSPIDRKVSNGVNDANDTQDANVSNDPAVSTAPPQRLSKQVEIADIGCGFGGLLFALAPRMPETLLLGLEIRSSVTEFVRDKVVALRKQHEEGSTTNGKPQTSTTQNAPDQEESETATTAPSTVDSASTATDAPTHDFQNVSCLRHNSMKFLPNLFFRHQLSALFLCFPDPHFKARKHKQRIVSPTLNSEYAFVLRPGGKVYTITDVEDLHLWMVGHFEGHASFERVGEEEQRGDWKVAVMEGATEEGQKVGRNGGRKFVAVFRRLVDPEWV